MAWITVNGERYKMPTPTDMTFDELCQAADMGAEIPTSEQATLNPRWLKAVVLVAKQRAGEIVNEKALGQLTLGDLQFEGDESPPANRAQRRAAGKKHSGGNGSSKSSSEPTAIRAVSGQ